MNLRSGSAGSDQGTTRTGSSAEHSADHSESILLHLSVSSGSGLGRNECLRIERGGIATKCVQPSSRRRLFQGLVVPERRMSSVGCFEQIDIGVCVDGVA